MVVRVSRAAWGLAVGLAVAVAASAATAVLKGWRDGPVRYLLSDEEYRAFGQLADDPSRREFIEKFWRDLDSDPSTPSNEYRDLFDARCAIADERFGIGRPGWTTDRGRVYILLGEPSDVRHETGGLKAADTEVWGYAGLGEPASDLRVVFYRCPDGDYRLRADCPPDGDASSVAHDWERIETLRRLVERNPGLALSRLRSFAGVVLAPVPGGVEFAVPAAGPSAAPAQGPIGTREIPADDSTSHEVEGTTFFFRAQDGTVLTLLSVELRGGARGGRPAADGGPSGPREGDGSDTYLGAASIESLSGSGERSAPLTVPLVRDVAESARGRAEFSGSAYLQAGRTYAVRYVVKDGSRDAIVVRSGRIEVPDLNRGLSASSVVPAERFGPAAPGAEHRYRVGSEEVVPKPGGAFRRGELLRLYLQVYGAAEDPRTGTPRVDVVFRFYREVRGGERRAREPLKVLGTTGASMGLAIPVGDLPAGDYHVTVDLKDRVSGERTSSETEFHILAD